VGDARTSCELLFRRHIVVDCRRSGNGYYSDGRVTTDHASLWRVPEEGPNSRETRL